MAAPEPKVKNVVHDMTIWKQLIENELKTAAEWEDNWGFLKAPRRPPRSQSHGAISGKASTPMLASAGMAVLQNSRGGGVGDRTNAGGFSARSDMSGYSDDRGKVLMRSAKVPKERFTRAVTTSHEVGWRNSIEKFGVGHYGLKRDPDLQPEI